MTNRNNSRFSIASLLVTLTIFAILFAWYVDHRNLVSQIDPPPKSHVTAYALSNASPELVAQKLEELFDSASVACNLESNAVIVIAEKSDHDRIDLIIRYIDRDDTDYVKIETDQSLVKPPVQSVIEQDSGSPTKFRVSEPKPSKATTR